MSTEDSEKLVLDTKPAKLRKTGGVTVQRIPAEWTKLTGLKAFFQGDLIIRLVRDNGQICIEIRTKPKETKGD